MTRNVQILYHQIHPLKIAADVLAAVISFYFFWGHELLIGILIHFGLPIAGAIPQAFRLLGDIVMSFGAWYRSIYVMGAGLAVIVLAWLNGQFRPRTR